MDDEVKNPDHALTDPVRAVVYLDGAPEPLLSLRPPVKFELDTTQLPDGEHVLRIEAFDSSNHKGVRIVPFTVRNGPGIAVSGLNDNDILEGKVPVLINFYGGSGEAQWEPSRAETPSPIPTWTWVLFIAIVAFGAFYAVRLWNPPARFANTPTFGNLAALPKTPPPSGAQGAPMMADLGNKVFLSNCAACHQAGGQGLPGTFPPLAGDPVVNAQDPTNHISIVLHGLHGKTINGVTYSSPMPAWDSQLNDEEIAAVINHERTSWGNHAPTITAQDVAKLRGSKK